MISDGPSVMHLASFVNGYPFKPEQLGEEGVPVVRIRQLLDDTADVESATPPDRAVWIGNGDLVFCWSATLAVREWSRGPALLNQHLFRVDVVPGVDKRWLRYVLEVAIDRLRPLMHGSAMTHITLEMLRSVRVALPALGDQRTIADHLDTETARIEALILRKQQMADRLTERFDAELAQSFESEDWPTPALSIVVRVAEGVMPRVVV